MSGAFIWYELLTPDPAAAKAFYDAVVGWDIATDPVAPGLEYRMIGRSDGGNAGGVMTLNEEMRANGARPVWLGYVHVEDVDATAAAIEKDGGTIRMSPWDQPGVGRLAMVTDPSGAPFYLMDPIPPEGQPDAVSDVFSVDRPQHVRWNELSSTDQDGAIDFYTRRFGWVQDGAMPMGEMGDYKFIHHDGTAIGAIMKKPDAMPVSLWTYYVGVDDIDRAERAISEGGGQVVQPPMQIPGGEYSLVAMDPMGASFGLVGPRN
ncbi:VOC family protein [Sphingomicrobium nitratireducens]|uniref:VOC family protein n=1 Tax=Sphingomicrobium nitratireducens TaxID=2964666 RepID=UPI00223EF4AF|nr:VOC family protein [Sphingomicrobium nitratireducens]